VAQLTYYSERETSEFPKDRATLDAMRREGRADYVVVTSTSRPPDWMTGLRASLVMDDTGPKSSVRIFALR